MKKYKPFSPKKTVVLTNTSKLRSKISLVEYNNSSDEEVDDQPTRKGPAASKNGGTQTTEKSVQVIPSRDNTSIKSFLMWENNANVCWLDASMALLVHNKTLVESLNEESTAQIVGIAKKYYEAVYLLNDFSDERQIDVRIQVAKNLLKTVQESTLKYLQPILKYKEGEPDSAFCSLFNLITEDKSVKDFFDLEFTWVQVCKKCNNHRVKKHKKPIVTLPRVAIFQASSPIAIYQCPVCKEPDQNMTLNFRTLPQCLLFHFESGAGKGELQSKDFEIDGRTYRMTGVMTLEKGKESNVNHFITFIRDPASDTWLECNDLNDEIMDFCMIPPFLELEDVYIIMYEAADRIGTVTNSSLALDKCGLGEESVSGGADIPLIDLADDTEKDSSSEKGSRGCNEPRLGSRRSKNVSLLETCEDGTSPSLSQTLNVDTTFETKSCDNNEISKRKRQSGPDEITAIPVLQETSLMNRRSSSDINEVGVASIKGMGLELIPLNIITKDGNSHEEIKQSHETSILVIEDSKKNKNVSCHTSIATKKGGAKMKNLIDTANKISGISKDLKAKDETELFMLNLDLYQKTKLEKSLQDKCISPSNQIKSLHNVSPTKIEASNKLQNEDISNKTAPGSPKSEGQMLEKTYKKLMRTLDKAVLKQEVPLAKHTKSGKSKVPNTELFDKLAAKELKSAVDVTNTGTDLKKQRVQKAAKPKHSEAITKITAKVPSCNVRKSPPNQRKKEDEVPNSPIVNAGFDKESKQDLVNIKDSTNLTVTTTKRQLVGPNKKRQRCNSDVISPYKIKEENSSEQAVQPKSKYRRRSVCVPDSITADIERPVSVDVKKHISVKAEEPVPKRVKCNRDSNSTSPKMSSGMIEQNADANTPKKTYSRRISETASRKSPLQCKDQINLEKMTNQKPVHNQDDQIIHAHSSNNCIQAKLEEQCPSNGNKNVQTNLKTMECREDCNPDALNMNETIDIVVDNVLNSLSGFFFMRNL